MKPILKLSVIGVILIAIGIGTITVFQATQDNQVIQAIQDNQVIQATQDNQVVQEIQDNQELTTYEKHNLIEELTELKVDRGSITIDLSRYSSKIPNEIDPVITLDKAFWEQRQKILEQRLSGSFLAKKQLVDSTFTCDNYNELAYQYQAEALPGFTINGKYDGTMEGYIYWKALNECIDPKLQEKVDKVYEELVKAGYNVTREG